MGNVWWRRFVVLFHISVWAVTIMSVTYCVYVYKLNEDLCIVEYKKYYEQKSDGFPRLSICFRDPILEPKLQKQEPSVTKNAYINYLKGEYYNKTYLEIDYFDTVLDLSEHILEYQIYWRNGDIDDFNITDYSTKKVFKPTYALIWETHFYQCYELQVPDNENISSFFAVVNSSLFPPRNKPLHYDLLTFMHYPNQLLISGKNVKFAWPEHGANDDFVMRFRIDGVEVVKIREKTGRPCHGGEDYDANIILRHAKHVGCRAPYHKDNAGLELCSTMELMKNVSWSLKKRDYRVSPPCNSMKKLDYFYEESSMNGTQFSRKGFLWIGIYFHDEQFKQILQTR